MKSKIISILALLLTVTQGAWALSGSGTQADPYLITSASDWHELAIQQTAYATGKYYRLTADISVTEGTNANLAFAGIFDGNGHTITLNITSSQQRAGLFPYIAYLTVKNLHVTGQITTSNTQAGGIAGCANHGTNKFENCRVSITISGSSDGYAHHAGFVGYVMNSSTKVELSNCVFDGTLTGDNVTRKWRGFIGYQESGTTATFTNCYFRPRSLSINSSTNGSDFFPFAYNGANSNTYANCLYTYQYSGTDLGSDGASGISTASTTVSTVVSTLGSDNWKSVTESSVEYVVPIWQYTVFFDANGGSGAPAAQTKKDGTALALSSTVPTREGYNFFKWNTKADGTGINYAAGETYTVNTGVTLYAKWRAIASYNVTANLASEAYWTTFYSNAGNYQAPEGTQVFTVSLEGTGITMNEVSDRIAKSGEGVVLKKTTTGNFTMTLTETAPAGDFSGNSLTGTMTSITNPGNAYVLGGTNGAGFYKLKDTGTIGANKAYLTYSGGGAAAARGFFLFDETTGIEMPTAEDDNADAVVYDLQGRRVLNPTKGLYIVNGKKVFINK